MGVVLMWRAMDLLLVLIVTVAVTILAVVVYEIVHFGRRKEFGRSARRAYRMALALAS